MMVTKMRVDNTTGKIEGNQEEVLAKFGLEDQEDVNVLKDVIAKYSKLIQPNFTVEKV